MDAVPVQSHRCEVALLGAVVADPGLTDGLAISGSQFSNPVRGVLYDAYRDLYAARGYVDEHMVRDWATDNWKGPNSELWSQVGAALDSAGFSGGVGSYVAEIVDAHRKRSLVEAGKDIVRAGYSDGDAHGSLELARQSLDLAERSFDGAVADGVGDMSRDYVQELLDIQSGKADAPRVPTGLGPLDDVLGGGFRPGWQVVVIAASGHGKSALCINNFALSAAQSGRPVLIASLEMPARDVVGRLVATISGVPLHLHDRPGALSSYQVADVIDAGQRVAALPLEIVTARDAIGIHAAARRLKRRHGDLGMVVVDHLHLMGGSSLRRNGTQEEEITANSMALKVMAMELECTNVLLVQPNQSAKRAERMMTVRDAKGSGGIEDNCDVALSPFLFHKADPDCAASREACKIGMSKFRDGMEVSLGETDVLWDGSRMRFGARCDL